MQSFEDDDDYFNDDIFAKIDSLVEQHRQAPKVRFLLLNMSEQIS